MTVEWLPTHYLKKNILYRSKDKISSLNNLFYGIDFLFETKKKNNVSRGVVLSEEDERKMSYKKVSILQIIFFCRLLLLFVDTCMYYPYTNKQMPSLSLSTPTSQLTNARMGRR